MKEEAKSNIGNNSLFKGTITAQSLKIDGTYEGDLLTLDFLGVGRDARVKCNIECMSIVVEGVVIGDIHASKRIFLAPCSKVLGNIKSPELIIQNGAILEGRCTVISEGVKNSVEEIVNKTYEN